MRKSCLASLSPGGLGERTRRPAPHPRPLSAPCTQENNVFYGHHAKIVCLAWSPDNEHFASGGMDMMVYVWTLSDPETRVKIQGDSHPLSSPPSGPGSAGHTRDVGPSPGTSPELSCLPQSLHAARTVPQAACCTGHRSGLVTALEPVTEIRGAGSGPGGRFLPVSVPTWFWSL